MDQKAASLKFKIGGSSDPGHWYFDAQIVRWVDDHQPGFVECRFIDSVGVEWAIVEKLPIVTLVELRSTSSFPQPAIIACEVISSGEDGSDRDIADVSTQKPWGIEATDGTTKFQIFVDHTTPQHLDGVFSKKS